MCGTKNTFYTYVTNVEIIMNKCKFQIVCFFFIVVVKTLIPVVDPDHEIR